MVNQIPRSNHDSESLMLIDTGCHFVCGVTRPSSSSKVIIIVSTKINRPCCWALGLGCFFLRIATTFVDLYSVVVPGG
jgi:hypothetical protein